MTDFSLLPVWAELLLSGLMFLSTLLVGALTLHELIRKRKMLRRAIDIAVFLILFIILSYITAFASEPEKVVNVHFPYIAVVVVSFLAVAYSTAGFVRNYRLSKNEISPLSVRQALDKLNSGVCFSDPSGRIILINHTMGELVYTLIGSYPRSFDEITSAMKKAKKINITQNEDSSELYVFPDKTIRRFYSVALTKEGLEGFTQTIAQDVTELYNANRSLEEENEQLSITNKEITHMLERLSDRIRQQETLALKMRVHNDIGSSLIKISGIISGDKGDDMETQLRLLKSAVSYFATDRFSSSKTLDEIIKSAGEMNVRLVIDGEIPPQQTAQGLIILACRECVTNCVKHAKGDTVNVKITDIGDCYAVRITNNGVAPTSEIKEGGGLSSLRQRVENADGKMNVLHSPVFELQLILKKEAQNDVQGDNC